MKAVMKQSTRYMERHFQQTPSPLPLISQIHTQLRRILINVLLSAFEADAAYSLSHSVHIWSPDTTGTNANTTPTTTSSYYRKGTLFT